MPQRVVKPIWPISLTPHDAAAALGVKRDDISAAIRGGLIPTYRKGLRHRILTEDLVRFVRENWMVRP